MKFLRNEKGFTLIELMVVILIIGILVAIAVPVFNNAKASAQRRACQSNMRIIDGAFQTFQADQPASGTYPTYAQLVPSYLKTFPICPANTVQYVPTTGGTTAPTVVCPNSIAGHTYP